jgi:hypothetical protein
VPAETALAGVHPALAGIDSLAEQHGITGPPFDQDTSFGGSIPLRRGAEAWEIGSRYRHERLNLYGSPSLSAPARIHPMQFDGVSLGADSHPHPFTIGSQQDRFNPEPVLVPNHHPHGNSLHKYE